MNYHCNKCKAFLCGEDEEMPGRCPNCRNGKHKSGLETMMLYSDAELRKMGRI